MTYTHISQQLLIFPTKNIFYHKIWHF